VRSEQILKRIAQASIIACAILSFPAAFAQEMTPGGQPTGGMQMMQPLMVSMQAIPAYGPAPLLVGFLLNITDPTNQQIVAFNWNFGDGHVATTNPIFTYNTYSNPGNFVATCTITTSDGRSATAFAGIIVKTPEGSQSAPQTMGQ
jgi:PKD domain